MKDGHPTHEEGGLNAYFVSREEMEKTYARDDHDELQKHVAAPVLIVKNESDDIENLRIKIKKVIKKI